MIPLSPSVLCTWVLTGRGRLPTVRSMPRGRKRQRRDPFTGEVAGGGDEPAFDGRELELMMVLAGMNQNVLAHESGLEPRDVSRLVNGHKALDRKTLKSLAKALDVLPSTFTAAKRFVDDFDRVRSFVALSRRRSGRWPRDAGRIADEVAEPPAEDSEWQGLAQDDELAQQVTRNLTEFLLRALRRG